MTEYNNDLEKWLRAHNMTTNEFTDMIGCSRPVIWKVKNGKPVSPRFAKAITSATDGAIIPLEESVGGRRL